jgi:predicted DCC family thiol-disulfide oxidoreductase YuxK
VVPESPILLYDGMCALCNGAVKFVLKRDRSQATRFAPLQGATAARILASHRGPDGIDSMVWVDPGGSVATRSAAALAIGRHIGGVWSVLATIASIVPAPLRDAVYDLVALHRYRWFGRYEACPIAPPEARSRFLP